jgi:N-acetylglucosamine-6-phosphate deacetylase
MNSETSGFIDLQVNGCIGVDFNANRLTRDDWNSARRYLHRDGTHAFLPTIITDDHQAMCRKLQTVAQHIRTDRLESNEDMAAAVGIHVEGPFILDRPGYVGAHPPQHACDAKLDIAKQLLDAGQGLVRLVTIAPERDPHCETIRFFADRGIVVAAGHTDASRDQLSRGLDSGLTMFTHLGNGCPATLPRHENIIHRVMSLRGRLYITLIADGHHLPPWLLRMFVEWFGPDRCIVVSDSISAAGLAPGTHRLGDQIVQVGLDGVPRSPDGTHFVGSGMTLGEMWRQLTGLSLESQAMEKLFRANALKLLGG